MRSLNFGQDNKDFSDVHLLFEALLGLPDPTTEGSSYEKDDAESTGAPKAIPFEDSADLVTIARGVITVREYAERQSGLKRQFTVRKDIVRLTNQVMICSSFIAVTPSIAASQHYKTYNNQCARAVILDEAAAMHRTDGLIVYWNTPRPIIVVGDEKQLVPTLITANQKDEAGTTFIGSATMLGWGLHLGFPAFHLYKQYRIAHVMFALSLEIVLEFVVNEFKYAESYELTSFSYAGDIRACLPYTANLLLPTDMIEE
ncbi:hypothetical protein LCI18_011600 [Fusarium solani-melongenae]|uniref:Uncharacterized protein n=1 Tax=Fusarium solani subsp. cucurbitae TaxID=2747967 RepID=A0ACD3ZHG5_FUSSC|nr:hypothetical protein LCI18_011600 [Fusarium solani-melongenae]